MLLILDFIIHESLYQSRYYSTFENFSLFQGPALYAYNDAEFTDDDWQSIRLVCDSLKEHDAMKVGRFGLGFKSVYHMTGEKNYGL